MLTLDQQKLIAGSFADIAEMAGPIAHLFYGRLFEIAPEVRPLFRQDIAIQSRKLMDMLAALVANLGRFQELEPLLRALGQRHAGYGVKPEHYAPVSAALLWAFGTALDENFPPELKAAWVVLIDQVSAVMKDGANALTPL
jgi:hemoglobin-like flavoprotein